MSQRPPPELQQALHNMLADSYLQPQPLPLCPQLQLQLIAPACLQRRFTPAEELAIQEHPAYWALCWPSGHWLAAYILQHPERVRGRSLIDVGCGSGAVAIAAALAGASEVHACDLDPVALAATRYNAALNGVVIHTSDDFRQCPHTDLLIAADLLYDQSNFWLPDAFRQQAREVWLAESRQRQWTHPDFMLANTGNASTQPDIGLADEFSTVRLFINRSE